MVVLYRKSLLALKHGGGSSNGRKGSSSAAAAAGGGAAVHAAEVAAAEAAEAELEQQLRRWRRQRLRGVPRSRRERIRVRAPPLHDWAAADANAGADAVGKAEEGPAAPAAPQAGSGEGAKRRRQQAAGQGGSSSDDAAGGSSNHGSSSHGSSGEDVATLMSVDTGRAVNLLLSFHELWSLPWQIGLALYLLYTQVGRGAGSGGRCVSAGKGVGGLGAAGAGGVLPSSACFNPSIMDGRPAIQPTQPITLCCFT